MDKKIYVSKKNVRKLLDKLNEIYEVFIPVQDKESGISLSCCNLWQNEAPQYGGVADQVTELRDNISEDPQFRNLSEMDFTPLEGSPVFAVPDCGDIGSDLHRVPVQ